MPPLLVIAVFALLLAPEPAEAWGAGMHVAQGSFIISNALQMIRPEVAALLAQYPLDYIYGCISADIFIGKGYRRRDDHCHNWKIGLRLLSESGDDPTRAYAYGYLSHLSADVVAHNYLIPNLLYKTPASKSIGHVYWEYRADRFIKKKHWKLAWEVALRRNSENDRLVQQVMKRSAVPFGVKKLVFKRGLRISDLTTMKHRVEESYTGARYLLKKEVTALNNYSLNLIIDFLRNGEKGIGLHFDPVGTDNTIEAKRRRKNDRNFREHNRNSDLFKPDAKIVELDYLNTTTIRY